MQESLSLPIPNLPSSTKKRVVIIGGGFAGLRLARKLKSSPFNVVLLDKNNYHQFQPLFYQVATAGLEPSAISFPLRRIFHHTPNVTFRMAEAIKIDQDEKRVYTNIGYLEYDYLVLGMGASTNYFGLTNIMEHSIPMKSVSEALFIRNKVISNYERAINIADEEELESLMNVVIVGGGPTGVELAGAVAELRNRVLPKDYPQLDFAKMKVVLVEMGKQLLSGMSEISSKRAKEYLDSLGVQVKLNSAVEDYNGRIVQIKDGEKIHTQTLLWAAGIKANKIEGIQPSQYSKSGRFLVDPYHQLPNSTSIYALGDVCLMKTEEFPDGHPQVAQVALQQADNLAHNLKNIQKQKDPRAFRYKDLGSMATVGKKLAVVDLPFIRFQGTLAWLTWLFVHLMAIVGVKNRLFIFLDWAWNYLSFDPALRLLIRPSYVKPRDREKLVEDKN